MIHRIGVTQMVDSGRLDDPDADEVVASLRAELMDALAADMFKHHGYSLGSYRDEATDAVAFTVKTNALPYEAQIALRQFFSETRRLDATENRSDASWAAAANALYRVLSSAPELTQEDMS